MANQLPEEVIRVHEKSLRLLDQSQEQLGHFKESLRKAIVRLTIAARSDNDQLNDVLEQIKTSVRDDIDLERLDAQLEELVKQVNRDRVNTDAAVNDEAGGADHQALVAFDDKVRNILGIDQADSAQQSVSALLDDLVQHISARVENNGNGAGDDREPDSARHVNGVLIDLVERLVLPEDAGEHKKTIARQLDDDLDEAGSRQNVVDNLVEMINKSIGVLQDEKAELRTFIKKITRQLAEIEKYVWQSRQERIDTANESSKLKDSVDNNVEAIRESVGAADDITRLKSDVQGYLSEIRKSVEEHQQAEFEREEMSKQGYAHIISELTRTQKETMMLKEQLEESKQKMLRDALTGLPNRMAYEERIALEVNRTRRNRSPLCLAMWDIDHFKSVNDTYGHDAGDRVLKLLAKIIVTRVRKVDMFARIGGEEFVLVMPDTAIDDALNLSNQLRTSLEDSGFHYKGSPCPITASVGIATLDENDTAQQLLEKADKALYQSKRDGRNRCTVYQHGD